jgi:predicted ATPase
MNKLGLYINGFKCFVDKHFELNNLTLLTGANASGKSSVIQALLILKNASESEEANCVLTLENPRFAFDFGYADSLINRELQEDKVTIGIDENGLVSFDGEKQNQDRKLVVEVSCPDLLKKVFANGLTYLNAERQGPRYEYVLTSTAEMNCGCHGENTGNVINDNWNSRIAGNRLPENNVETAFFNIALDKWVDYIFPGIAVRVTPVGSHSFKVIVRDNNHNVNTDSTNIGFGISYALPILVSALLAKENSWLIVENPEAHIHAKAQSNMGYFLGMMAAAGLRVVAETHSEHIVNGIRKATIVSGRLKPEEMNIYFFKGKSESELITVDKYGNLSDFPVDFFDQSRQDMLEIIKKTRE